MRKIKIKIKKGFKKINKVKEAVSEYDKDAIERAKDYGLDLSLLYENLSRSPTERMENFARWLEFVDELKKVKQNADNSENP